MAKGSGRREGGPGSLARLAHFSSGPPVTHPFLHLYYYYAHFTEESGCTSRVWVWGTLKPALLCLVTQCLPTPFPFLSYVLQS